MSKNRILLTLIVVLMLGATLCLAACGDDTTVTIKSIALKEGQNTTFDVSNFSFSDITILVTDSEGYTFERTLDSSMFSEADVKAFETPGDHTVTIIYDKQTLPFDIHITNESGIIIDGDTTVIVSFETNGGTPSTITPIIGKDSANVKAEDIETVTKENMEFGGWYTNSALTNKATFPINTANSITLYAKWNPISITVSFDVNAENLPPVSPYTVSMGNKISLPEGVERTGYSFTGWYEDKECTKAVKASKAYYADTTLYAGWKVLSYILTFELAGGTYNSSTRDVQISYEYGKSIKPIEPTRANFSFNNWYDTETGMVYIFSTMPAEDVVLKATWNITDPGTYFATSKNLDGTLTISGFASGVDTAVSDLYIPNIAEYTDVATGKTEFLKVTAIGDKAFKGNRSIESIRIAEGIVRIGANAFYSCSNLDSYKSFIAESVTDIGEYAFPETWEYQTVGGIYGYVNNILVKYSGGGGNVIIAEGTTSIADGAFKNNTDIRTLSVAASVTSIGNAAFAGATSLWRVEFAKGSIIKSVASDAFANTSYISRVASINDSLYSQFVVFGNLLYKYNGSTSATSVTIPAGVKYIASEVFIGYTSIAKVYFGDSQNSAEDDIEYIGALAFYNTGWANNNDYIIVNGILCNVRYNSGVTIYRIPSTYTKANGETAAITTIAPRAFERVKSKVTGTTTINVVLPSSITTICDYAFFGINNLNLTLNCNQTPSLELSAFYKSQSGDSFSSVNIFVNKEAESSYINNSEYNAWNKLSSQIQVLRVVELSNVKNIKTAYYLGDAIDLSAAVFSYTTNDGLMYPNVPVSDATLDYLYTTSVTKNSPREMELSYSLTVNSAVEPAVLNIPYTVAPVLKYIFVGQQNDSGLIVSGTQPANSYFLNGALNLTGVKLSAVYYNYINSNGQYDEGRTTIELIDVMVNDGEGNYTLNPLVSYSGFSSDTLTDEMPRAFTFSYGGVTCTFDYVVIEKTIIDVKIPVYIPAADGEYICCRYIPTNVDIATIQAACAENPITTWYYFVEAVYTEDENGIWYSDGADGYTLIAPEGADESTPKYTRTYPSTPKYCVDGGYSEDDAFFYDTSGANNNAGVMVEYNSNYGFHDTLTDENGTRKYTRYTRNGLYDYVDFDLSAHEDLDEEFGADVPSYNFLEALNSSDIYIKCTFDQLIDGTEEHEIAYLLISNSVFEITGFETNAVTEAGSPKTAAITYISNNSLNVFFDYNVTASTAERYFDYDATGEKAIINGLNSDYPSTIYIPDTLDGKPVTIANEAFKNYQGIKVVYIGAGVTAIGESAFEGSSVEYVTFFENCAVTEIAANTFKDTEALVTVSFNGTQNIVSISESAFENSNINDFTLPASVQTIQKYAFKNCLLLSSFDASESALDYIGTEAFRGDVSLLNITMSSSLATLGNAAFQFCTVLEKITLPDTLTIIPQYAFYGCSSLTEVTMAKITTIGVHAFDSCTALATIKGNSAVVNIGDYAFHRNSSLNSLGIVFTSLEYIGVSAFDMASSLSSFDISGSASLGTIGSAALRGTAITAITIPASVSKFSTDTIADCNKLTSVTILASLEQIPSSMFADFTLLTSVTLPDSITSIGDSAFRNTALNAFTISSSVESIGDKAFENCASLSSVSFAQNAPSSYAVTSIGAYCFSGCTALTSFNLPNTVTTIGKNIFAGSGLATFTFGENATLGAIPEYAFTGTAINSITIPAAVAEIAAYSFFGCTSLTSLTVSENNNLVLIGESAFQNCDALTDISIGIKDKASYSADNAATLLSIGKKAFASCTGITSLTLPITVVSVGESAFLDCSSITEIYFGVLREDIYRAATNEDKGASDWLTRNRYVLIDGAYVIYDEATHGASATLYVTDETLVAQEQTRSMLKTIGTDAFANTFNLRALYITAANPESFGSAKTNLANKQFGYYEYSIEDSVTTKYFVSHFENASFELHIANDSSNNDDEDYYTVWTESSKSYSADIALTYTAA